jgi:hypothetical protein
MSQSKSCGGYWELAEVPVAVVVAYAGVDPAHCHTTLTIGEGVHMDSKALEQPLQAAAVDFACIGPPKYR